MCGGGGYGEMINHLSWYNGDTIKWKMSKHCESVLWLNGSNSDMLKLSLWCIVIFNYLCHNILVGFDHYLSILTGDSNTDIGLSNDYVISNLTDN